MSVDQWIDRQYGGLRRANHPVVMQQRIVCDRYEFANRLADKDLFGHHACVNAVEFSGNGQLMFSGTLFAAFFISIPNTNPRFDLQAATTAECWSGKSVRLLAALFCRIQ
jgi:hypothetical protein